MRKNEIQQRYQGQIISRNISGLLGSCCWGNKIDDARKHDRYSFEKRAHGILQKNVDVYGD